MRWIPLLICLALPVTTAAHVRLLSPEPRSDSDAIKSGPCGRNGPGSGVRTEVAAGSTLTVRFEETVDHPGHFRVAFSPDGDGGYDANVLLDDIPIRRDDRRPHQYEVEVRVPDRPCERCGLQVIQYMLEDPRRPSLYFSCADLRVVAAAPAPDMAVEPPPADAAVATPDAAMALPDAAPGAPADARVDPARADAAADGGAATESVDGESGCSATGAGSALWWALVALGLRGRGAARARPRR